MVSKENITVTIPMKFHWCTLFKYVGCHRILLVSVVVILHSHRLLPFLLSFYLRVNWRQHWFVTALFFLLVGLRLYHHPTLEWRLMSHCKPLTCLRCPFLDH